MAAPSQDDHGGRHEETPGPGPKVARFYLAATVACIATSCIGGFRAIDLTWGRYLWVAVCLLGSVFVGLVMITKSGRTAERTESLTFARVISEREGYVDEHMPFSRCSGRFGILPRIGRRWGTPTLQRPGMGVCLCRPDLHGSQ